jgi:hypothetical protein
MHLTRPTEKACHPTTEAGHIYRPISILDNSVEFCLECLDARKFSVAIDENRSGQLRFTSLRETCLAFF